jgi:hypothetical protein
LGKKKRDKELEELRKEKELLEVQNLKLQIREKLAGIISTIVVLIISVVTAILKWVGLID